MTDTLTRKPITIRDVGTPWPWIRLAYSQVPEVRQILDAHGVRYWMQEQVISIDGGPEIAYLRLGKETDTPALQVILDKVG